MNTKSYKRRTPEKTSFYKIVYNYFEEYKNVYSERYENEYGYFRNIVSDVVEKYLECGLLENGMARVFFHFLLVNSQQSLT